MTSSVTSLTESLPKACYGGDNEKVQKHEQSRSARIFWVGEIDRTDKR